MVFGLMKFACRNRFGHAMTLLEHKWSLWRGDRADVSRSHAKGCSTASGQRIGTAFGAAQADQLHKIWQPRPALYTSISAPGSHVHAMRLTPILGEDGAA
jgi:hypothetical protein